MSGTKQDILIHAGAQDLGHKWVTNLSDDELAYWRVSGTPRQTEPGHRIWFEHNGTIHAWGEIVSLDDGRIWFDGARQTHVPCLDDAPTRGFTYIDPLLPRLEETEWHEKDSGEIVVPDGGRVKGDTDRIECENCGYQRPTFEACPECGEFGRGEQYLDDRTTLAYAYDGDQLVAKLFKERAVRECQHSGWLTVTLTPAGEERSLSEGEHDV